MSKLYVVKVPATPSAAINSMLQTRCGKPHASPVKAGLSYAVCGFFRAVLLVYSYLYTRKDRASHTYWTAACGAVSTGAVVATYVLYNMLIISAVVLQSLLYYAAFLLALVGIGLGVSGVLFFDKDGDKSGSGSAYRVGDMAAKFDSVGGGIPASAAHGSGDASGMFKSQ